jgi:hypothetical protein
MGFVVPVCMCAYINYIYMYDYMCVYVTAGDDDYDDHQHRCRARRTRCLQLCYITAEDQRTQDKQSKQRGSLRANSVFFIASLGIFFSERTLVQCLRYCTLCNADLRHSSLNLGLSLISRFHSSWLF